MTADVADVDDDDANRGQAMAAPKRLGRRKLALICAVLAALLIGGGGYTLLSHRSAKAGSGQVAAAASDTQADHFIDVPPVMVNMRSPDGAARFLKVHFMIVPADGTKEEEVKRKLPLLLDAFQPFLRELRPEDLAGSAAIFRIKEELLVRAQDTLGAGQVDDILIQDLIQQ